MFVRLGVGECRGGIGAKDCTTRRVGEGANEAEGWLDGLIACEEERLHAARNTREQAIPKPRQKISSQDFELFKTKTSMEMKPAAPCENCSAASCVEGRIDIHAG